MLTQGKSGKAVRARVEEGIEDIEEFSYCRGYSRGSFLYILKIYVKGVQIMVKLKSEAIQGLIQNQFKHNIDESLVSAIQFSRLKSLSL